MSFTVQEIRELKPGRYVVVDEQPCKILSISTSKPGKHGAAKARMDVLGVFDNQKRTITGPVTEKVQVPIIDRRQGQIVSIQGETAQMMDLATYQTFEIEIPDGMAGDLEPGKDVTYLEAMGRRMITRT